MFAFQSSSIFVNESNQFKVVFPYDYATVSDTIATDLGQIAVTNVFSREERDSDLAVEDQTLYVMTFFKYPEGTLEGFEEDLVTELINDGIEQRKVEFNGKVDYMDVLEEEHYNGKIIRMTAIDDPLKFAKAKYIVFKDYFIVIQSSGLKGRHNQKRIENFQNSFKVLNP
jgi:hypothetical protein